MSRKHDIVREDAIGAELHIVAEVHIHHQQVLISDSRHPIAVNLAAVNRSQMSSYMFTDHVAVADLQRGRFASIFQILGRSSEGCAWKNLVISTEFCSSRDNDMADQMRSRADRNVRAYRA